MTTQERPKLVQPMRGGSSMTDAAKEVRPVHGFPGMCGGRGPDGGFRVFRNCRDGVTRENQERVLVCKGSGWRTEVPMSMVAVFPRTSRSTYQGVGFRTFRPVRLAAGQVLAP